MTARDFCFWLQGYFEVVGANPAPVGGLTPAQAATVQRHLSLVFAHEIDPQAGGVAEQEKLNAVHNAPFLNYPPGVRC